MNGRGFTPGPWFSGRALRGGQECVIGDGDSVVCFMPDRTIGCTFIPQDSRLIAAAPSMYDFVWRAAEAGDGVAKTILEAIHGRA